MRKLPPLAHAVAQGTLDECKALIAMAVDVNDGGQHGSPLHIAAEKGQNPWCRLLIESGADLSKLNSLGWTALGLAARNAYPETCRLLIGAGADPCVSSSSGEDALTLANSLRSGREILPILLEANQITRPDRPSHVTASLNSALCRYAESGDMLSCQRLIDVGADVNGFSHGGATPLMCAAAKDGRETCELLIQRGAHLSLTGKSGQADPLTAFQAAVRSGAVDVANYFIEHHGEDVAQRTARGRTMNQLASKHSHMKEALKAARTVQAVSDVIGDLGAIAAHAPRSAGLAL